MERDWVQIEDFLVLTENSEKVRNLENEIYILRVHPKYGIVLIRTYKEKFEFKFKPYALEEEFISHVMIGYKNIPGNIGILMNGIKGTGKSVVGKEIANRLNLPIIVIEQASKDIPSFISRIQQEVIIFVDEYEKVFNERETYDEEGNVLSSGSHMLLSLMDGAMDFSYRRFFILTTNKTYINSNILNRPGRIRFYKEFSNLHPSQVKTLIDELLEDSSFQESIVQYMSTLEIITVDIVKAVISQVNLLKTPPVESCKYLNVIKKADTYQLVEVDRSTGKESHIIETDISVEAFENVGLKRDIIPPTTFYLRGGSCYITDVKKISENMIEANLNGGRKPILMVFRKNKVFHSSLVF